MSTHEFEVTPLIGIGPVKLGMTRAEAESAMTVLSPKKRGRNVFEEDYFGGAFRVFISEGELVEGIELSRDDVLAAIYKGRDLFMLPALDCIEFVSQDGKAQRQDSEGHSFHFPTLGLAFWRPYVIETYDEDEERGYFFATVAVFRQGYYES